MTEESGIAERFREVRAKTNLSQKDFAESVGVSQSVVSDIERGAREPSRQILAVLAEKYAVDLNWLLLGIGPGEKISQNQIRDAEVERLEREIDELKKSIDELERENKELSKELLDRMRQLLGFKTEQGHAPA
jgi:transcriptional regulator with XRE-family HTH domain